MALMLTRRAGEAVDVYDKEKRCVLTVRVHEFLPNGIVRLAFEADRDYTILRDNAKERHGGSASLGNDAAALAAALQPATAATWPAVSLDDEDDVDGNR